MHFLGCLGDFKVDVVTLTGPTKPCATGVWLVGWDGMGVSSKWSTFILVVTNSLTTNAPLFPWMEMEMILSEIGAYLL